MIQEGLEGFRNGKGGRKKRERERNLSSQIGKDTQKQTTLF